MAAMVNQTLSQMLQATPPPTQGSGARSAEGNGATHDAFSNTLERKMAEPEQPREATAKPTQEARKQQDNQPVKDKEAPAQRAANGESADEARPTEPTPQDAKTKPAEDKAEVADKARPDGTDETDTAAVTGTEVASDVLAATPAELAASPAIAAAATATAATVETSASAAAAATALSAQMTKTETPAADKATKPVDVLAGAMAANGKPAMSSDAGKETAADADLGGGKARALPTDTALRAKVPVLREGVSNFSAQLDAQIAGTAKPGEAIQMTPSGATPGTGVPGALGAAMATPAANTPAASQPVLPSHLATPVGSQQWPDAVGNRVMWLAGRDESRAELILTPPSLGKLEISLTVTGDTTTAQFTAATPAAREALEQAMPRLREMLESAGITLAESNVNTAPQDQPGERGEGRQFANGRHAVGGEMAMHNAGTHAGRWIARSEGMIDTFA